MRNLTYLISILFFINLICTVSVYAQQEVNTDKIIIDGKTYYLHVVQQGEGFYGIAKKYGVSQKEIHEANPDAIFGLKPGDILHIPVISGRNSNSEEISGANKFVYHTIEKGQTLYFLSKKYNVSVDEIKKYNVGSEQNLIVGSIIKIPVPQERKIVKEGNVSYQFHQVEPKETLYGISQKYHVEITDLILHNPALKSGILKVGSTLRIPVQQVQVKSEVIKVREQLEDNKYLYHKIQAGDTFFSLSKRYNVSKDVLIETNPGLNPEDLKLGFIVRIPKKDIGNKLESNLQEPQLKIHVVKRKETVYSIAKKYGVSIEEIKEVNPTLILRNIKKGSHLNIPTPAYFTHKKQLESQNLVKDNTDLKEQKWDSLHVDCGQYSYFPQKEVIKIAVLLPFNVEATRQSNIIKKKIGNEEIEIAREDSVLSIRSRSFVEFYEGVLLSVDSMKKRGINISLYTFDTAPDTNKVKQILENPVLKTVDFIIGPVYSDNLQLVSDFSYRHGIKMIYPLSGTNEVLNSNPFVFQINTQDSLLYNKYSKYIISKSDTAKIVVLKSSKPEIDEEAFCKEIKDLLYIKHLALGQVPDYKELIFSEKDVQGISSVLSKEKYNVVVVPSSKEADVSKIITTLNGVVETSNRKVNLIGFGSWLKYQTIEVENIHALNTEILTLYCLDYKNEVVNNFIGKFRKKFYTEPYAVAPYFVRPDRNSKFSKYGIWGYDVAHYFIGARVQYGKNFEYCLPQYNAKQVMFDFKFKRAANWGGFYNNGLYVLKFTSDLNIYRLPLN